MISDFIEEPPFPVLLLTGIFTLVSFFTFAIITQKKYDYEYVDIDGNKGHAKNCSYYFNDGRSGGHGSPVCELEDGTVIQVKQYKLISSRNCNGFVEICS